MKQFGTHLPPMPRVELLVVLGQVQRALDVRTGGAWQVISEVGAGSDLKLVARVASVSLVCEVAGSPEHDCELRVTFEEGPTPSQETEILIGTAMRSVHSALIMMLGQPPTGQMWLMTGGRWIYGSKFSS
jgi:hypothetical protein